MRLDYICGINPNVSNITLGNVTDFKKNFVLAVPISTGFSG